jgi:hypothetical protein
MPSLSDMFLKSTQSKRDGGNMSWKENKVANDLGVLLQLPVTVEDLLHPTASRYG